jgi:hypothetical protein
MSLEKCLKLPSTRLETYVRTLEATLSATPPSNPSYPKWQQGLLNVMSLFSRVTNDVSLERDMSLMTLLQKRFDGAVEIKETARINRRLVHSGSLRKVCRKIHKKFAFFLFSDLLVYCSHHTVGLHVRVLPHHASGTGAAIPRWWPTAAYGFTVPFHLIRSSLSTLCPTLPCIAFKSLWRPPPTLLSCLQCQRMSSNSGSLRSKTITPSLAYCLLYLTLSPLSGYLTYYVLPVLAAAASLPSSSVAITAECAAQACAMHAAEAG